MNSTNKPDRPDAAATPGDFSAVLDRMWIRFLPETRKRVEMLKSGAEPASPLREAAAAEAHKLAGSLGTFNLARGTELAREYEVLAGDSNATGEGTSKRLMEIAAELATIVEGR